jgi:hypothetical protein
VQYSLAAPQKRHRIPAAMCFSSMPRHDTNWAAI